MRAILGVLVAAGLLLVGQTASAQTLVEKGQAVYAAQKCMMCHAIAGKGNAKGALDGVGKKLTVEDIRLWIVDPVTMTARTKAPRKPLMKAYPSLPKADLDALVAYMVSLK
jgi:mono/diheme cytochrome c family protein